MLNLIIGFALILQFYMSYQTEKINQKLYPNWGPNKIGVFLIWSLLFLGVLNVLWGTITILG